MLILPLILSISGILVFIIGCAIASNFLIGAGCVLFLSTFVLPALCDILCDIIKDSFNNK